MSHIIPIRPFGKDLTSIDDKVDLSSDNSSSASQTSGSQSSVSTNGVNNISDELSKIIPPYDFSAVTHEENGGYTFLNNVPFNTFKDGRWMQGIWKSLVIFKSRIPLGKVAEKRVAADWVLYNRTSVEHNGSNPIVPSLPLYLVVFGALQAVAEKAKGKSGESDTVRIIEEFRNSYAADFLSQTYTSSQVVETASSTSSKLVVSHGLGLGDHPVQYQIKNFFHVVNNSKSSTFREWWMSYSSTGFGLRVEEDLREDKLGDVWRMFFACPDLSQVRDIMRWVYDGKSYFVRFDKINTIPKSVVLVAGDTHIYSSDVPVIGINNPLEKHFARGIIANPKDFKVFP